MDDSVDHALHIFGADQAPIAEGQGARLDTRLRDRGFTLGGLRSARAFATLGRIHFREDEW